MNPFDYRGPEFLAFYVAFAAATLLLLYYVRQSRESGALPTSNARDPYLLACLSGGPKEAIRVAVLGLVDRDLLDIASGIPWTRKDVKPSAGQNRMEKAILERCKSSCALNVLIADKSLLDLARQEYEDKLKAQGLVPDAAQLQFRFVSRVVAVVALAGVAGLKVWIALERG